MKTKSEQEARLKVLRKSFCAQGWKSEKNPGMPGTGQRHRSKMLRATFSPASGKKPVTRASGPHLCPTGFLGTLHPSSSEWAPVSSPTPWLAPGCLPRHPPRWLLYLPPSGAPKSSPLPFLTLPPKKSEKWIQGFKRNKFRAFLKIIEYRNSLLYHTQFIHLSNIH